MFHCLSLGQMLAAAFGRSSGDLSPARRLKELRKQIPALYLLLSANACALAATHYPLAPAFLTLIFPTIAVPTCLARSWYWWRMQPAHFSDAEAVRQFQRTTILTAVFSIAFICWAMILNRYGGPFEQGHVAVFVGVTVIGCIFCLTHLPIAAVLATGIVMSVFMICCVTSGSRVLLAIAVNIAFVTAVMMRVLISNERAFVALVASQAKASRLSDDNARLAETDLLTELPNRRYFFQCLDSWIRTARGTDTPFALAIFDLDRFKPINDTYGHTVGDRVLAETGRRLETFASPTVTVTRLGGDEFGVLIRPPVTPEAVLTLCDAICTALQQPILVGDIRVATGCSGGLAIFPGAGRDADTLFDRADYALYHSKEHQRGVTTCFSKDHEEAIRAERAVETALRGADLASEMEVHYQPILEVGTGAIALVEALARWTSPVLGRVPPDRFVMAAERCGMIHTLTLLLLRKALTDAEQLPATIGLSFNLSAHDLSSAETVLGIIAAVRESGFDPRRLTLELTETALMLDFEQAKQAITTLHALGIKIALDDFGTGYSSLGYVHRLPLDRIKIDRSFMADIGTAVGSSLVTTVLDLCRNLGLDSIAEGVETLPQFEAARRHGCRYIQGYLIGKPMPIDAVLERLQQDRLAVAI